MRFNAQQSASPMFYASGMSRFSSYLYMVKTLVFDNSLQRKTASILAILVCSVSFIQPTHASQPDSMEKLFSGGPYIGTGRGVQRVKASLPYNGDSSRPIYLTIFNGYGDHPGFVSARIILSNQSVRSYNTTEPSGTIVTDRDSFRIRNTVSKDLTGELGPDSNLVFELEGAKGAQLSWILSAKDGPRLSPLNPTETLSGRTVILHGKNFSTDPGDNTVTFGGKQARVVAATRTSLTVIPPESVENGNAPITVRVNGVSSNSIDMAVRPMPILTRIYPDGGPPGEYLTVYGRGFARPLNANIVRIGPLTAQIVGATDDGGIRVIIPDWGTAFQGQAVSVISDGVPSRNNLTFYPNAHIFIEGSAF